jgi:hypothetical protein
MNALYEVTASGWLPFVSGSKGSLHKHAQESRESHRRSLGTHSDSPNQPNIVFGAVVFDGITKCKASPIATIEYSDIKQGVGLGWVSKVRFVVSKQLGQGLKSSGDSAASIQHAKPSDDKDNVDDAPSKQTGWSVLGVIGRTGMVLVAWAQPGIYQDAQTRMWSLKGGK